MAMPVHRGYLLSFQHTAARRRLASNLLTAVVRMLCFNTQPPEGGWVRRGWIAAGKTFVSTHSRPKAAGYLKGGYYVS